MTLQEICAIPLKDVAHARQMFALTQALAQAQSVQLRPPPPEPQHCCGRGCQGCVWDGFFYAAQYWLDDAADLLRE